MRDLDAYQLVGAPVTALAALAASWPRAQQRLVVGTADVAGVGPTVRTRNPQTPTVSVGILPATQTDAVATWAVSFQASHPHAGGAVQDVAAISETVFVTAGSHGGVHLFDVVGERDGGGPLGLRPIQSWTNAHAYPSGTAAPTSAVAVRPFDALDPEFASVGEDGRLALFRPDRATAVAQASADALVLSDVCYLGRDCLVTVGASGTVKMWDARQAFDRPLAVLASSPSADRPLLSVQGRPSRSDWLVTGSASGAVALWDVRSLARVECADTAVHRGGVNAVAHHPNAPSKVFTASADGTVGSISFGDVAARPPVRCDLWRHLLASQLAVNSVVVAEAHDLLIAGTQDGALLLKGVRVATG